MIRRRHWRRKKRPPPPGQPSQRWQRARNGGARWRERRWRGAGAGGGSGRTPPELPTATAPLPDMSLVLTLVPCALYDGGQCANRIRAG